MSEIREIIGNTTATPNPRPDWLQTDETKADYIKNKPDIEERINAIKTLPYTYTDFSFGGIASASGADTEGMTRIKSGYIDINSFVSATVGNSDFVIVGYIYGENKTYLGRVFNGSWVSAVTEKDVKAVFDNARYVRFIMKHNTDRVLILEEDVELSGLKIEISTIKEMRESINTLQESVSKIIADNNDVGIIADQMMDNFDDGEVIKYSFGEAKYNSLVTSISAFSTFTGWAVPIMKNSLRDIVRGVTVFLTFNVPEANVALDLYDQNKKLIKSLTTDVVKAPLVATTSDVYATLHTFKCEFSKDLIPTDAAYLRIYIPEPAAKRIRLGTVSGGQKREEIDVSVTPLYYSTNGNSTWVAQVVSDGKGDYVNAPEKTFIQIIEKSFQIKVPKSAFALDYATYGLPVLEFNGNITNMNKDNAVSLTYKYGEREGTCTLKWQGSSSIAYPKKNYTVKFDTAFEAKEGWGEQKKYCLKANYIDFSHSRNLCSAKLWSGMVKSRVAGNETLNGLVNGGAVDGFPICVVINGEYKGLYTFNIPKDGWMFGMGDGENEAILCADASKIGACSFDSLSTLDGDFDVEYAPDEDNVDWIRTSLNRLIQACIDSDGTDLDTTISQYLDWESAIDYYIYCLVSQNYDGITKNYILATYDGVKWFFSAYDMDSTYGLWWDGSYFIKANSTVLVDSAADTHRLFKLIKTYKADELKARYDQLVINASGVLSEENVTKTFLDFAGSIPKAILDEEVKVWTTIPSTSTNNVSQILDFYRRRRKYIDPQIEALS